MAVRRWGSRSLKVYNTLDRRLQKVCDRLLQEVADISLIQGHRNKEDQDAAFEEGTSQLRWPDGNHNRLPSLAVDLQPYPYPQADEELWGSLGYIAGAAIVIGREEGITLRWGGDWNGNGSLADNKFDDLFHLEIRE